MKYHHGNLRSELIRCACTLCEEHGHDKISLRGIAKEANGNTRVQKYLKDEVTRLIKDLKI